MAKLFAFLCEKLCKLFGLKEKVKVLVMSIVRTNLYDASAI